MVYRLCKTSASHEFGAEFTAPATGVIMYKPDQDAEGFPHNRFDRLRLPGLIKDQNRTRFLCQRKVEMSGFLPSRNVRFQGFLQG